jgi:hypothetical protein
MISFLKGHTSYNRPMKNTSLYKEHRFMGKSKKKKEFDVHNMTPDEQLKFEIAQELGLDEKVLQKGWKSLTSKESGRIGGMITGRKRQLKEEALKES